MAAEPEEQKVGPESLCCYRGFRRAPQLASAVQLGSRSQGLAVRGAGVSSHPWRPRGWSARWFLVGTKKGCDLVHTEEVATKRK